MKLGVKCHTILMHHLHSKYRLWPIFAPILFYHIEKIFLFSRSISELNWIWTEGLLCTGWKLDNVESDIGHQAVLIHNKRKLQFLDFLSDILSSLSNAPAPSFLFLIVVSKPAKSYTRLPLVSRWNNCVRLSSPDMLEYLWPYSLFQTLHNQ